jgi:hypothetical protein
VKHASVRKAVRDAIGEALDELRPESPDDKSVHRARKDLKRARAGLRLLRDAIGRPAYRRENARLRDAGKPLSRVRDAKVMADTIAKLWPRARKREKAVLRALRSRLAGEKRRAHDELARVKAQAVVRPLQAASRVAKRWDAMPRDRESSRKGIVRIYRNARKAAAAAQASKTDPNLHEARKQAKYLGIALALVDPPDGGKAGRRALDLASRLGDDHDLAVLLSHLRHPATPDAQSAAERLRRRIEERRRKLQRKALKRAAGLYTKKPKRFVRRAIRA